MAAWLGGQACASSSSVVLKPRNKRLYSYYRACGLPAGIALFYLDWHLEVASRSSRGEVWDTASTDGNTCLHTSGRFYHAVLRSECSCKCEHDNLAGIRLTEHAINDLCVHVYVWKNNQQAQ